MPQAPFLSPPDAQYKKSFIAAIREFEREGVRPPWQYDKLENHFDEYVATLKAAADDPMPGLVPQSTYWLIADGAYAGTINIRHRLTNSLKRYGGHIGYRIRPMMRRKGYGTLQLKLALPKVWSMGISKALITCDDDNIGSQKIIEANGGILQDKVDNKRQALTRRYWIAQPDASSFSKRV